MRVRDSLMAALFALDSKSVVGEAITQFLDGHRHCPKRASALPRWSIQYVAS